MSAYDVRGVQRTAGNIRAEIRQWQAYLAQMEVLSVLATGLDVIRHRIENLEIPAILREKEENDGVHE